LDLILSTIAEVTRTEKATWQSHSALRANLDSIAVSALIAKLESKVGFRIDLRQLESSDLETPLTLKRFLAGGSVKTLSYV
jgi:acyl carrier protein